ncbi:CaiB/BaiF CoA transferase family protein [Quisquiliibacterium transsilvanicum]|uniref:Crotonobetainyl-CoA:carnitine CoA-transferase CaiB-like acyl-CoA transferase n=1 Tax=Quisquiliibacterium transsilvanicum TaxID=1549638 RepID=A0A7W8HM11_9BURK|nr:CoA transferase [Quisquiliibacterium transsilvanicum]MBB5273578.1 crotonobetainyl-CoA:carnitine CoA-transferase CaiB-like acyl-CoA transferase [Quisquiliibacterium transsilvanicum]
MSTSQAPIGGALAGVRIVDLTAVIFGPYCTQILADYGADVIKVEAPEGDTTRWTGPSLDHGRAAIFLAANRNKRSVVLDLKQPAAREALLALVDTADVFVHSVRPQKLEKLGLGPAALMARNPRLIYAGLHGFGSDGPYAGQPAYDDIIQGLSGVADLMERQTGTPRYFPTIAADKACGQVAAHAVLAALFQRERTGRGQCVEVPMFESMTSFMLLEHFYGRHLAREGEPDPAPGPARGADGDGDGDAAQAHSAGYPRLLTPWRRPQRTADGHVCILPYTTAHWQLFFEHTGHPELASDPRFQDIASRTRHIAELYEIAGEIVAHRDTAWWLELCKRLEIPAAPVNRLEDMEHDPHLKAVGLFPTVHGDDGSACRLVRNPVRLADSEVPMRMPPSLGEHTLEVLAEAGLDAEAIRRLVGSGAARTHAGGSGGPEQDR